MLKILLKSNEFDSFEYGSDLNSFSCKVANLKIHRTDERYLNIIRSKKFEAIILNPKFRYSKEVGYYKLSNCVLCSCGDYIQINYWQIKKIDDFEKRNFLIDFIIDT